MSIKSLLVSPPLQTISKELKNVRPFLPGIDLVGMNLCLPGLKGWITVMCSLGYHLQLEAEAKAAQGPSPVYSGKKGPPFSKQAQIKALDD